MDEVSESQMDAIATDFVERVRASCGFSVGVTLDIWAVSSFLNMLCSDVPCSVEVLCVGRDLLVRLITLGQEVGAMAYVEIMYGAYEHVCQDLAQYCGRR